MDAEDEVDVHFVYFAEWHKNSHPYEMDDDGKVPLDTGVLLRSQEHNFAAGGLSIVRKFIEREKGGDEISGW